MVASSPAACGLLALVRLSAAQLVVNEFASGDNVALGSTYGNDWFEVFNNGSSTEDLSQWSVCDSEGAYVALGASGDTLEPGAYYVVKADDDASGVVDTEGYWHVPFKLGSDDSLTLRAPDGAVADTVAWAEGDANGYPSDHDDVCWGRCPDGTAVWGLTSPVPGDGTPNAPNPSSPYAYGALDSCVELGCGNHAADESCWCTDSCVGYGDCCADYDATCVHNTPAPTSTRAPSLAPTVSATVASCAAATAESTSATSPLADYAAADDDDGAVGASTGLAAFLAVVEENLSGVSFDRERCTLWAVRNRPCGLYEVSLDGSTLRVFDLDATFYDTEGVVVLESGTVAITEEDLNTINICDVRRDGAGGVLDRASCTTIETGVASAVTNKGIEGVAWDAARARFYIIIEKAPMRVLSVGLDGRVAELFDAEVAFAGVCTDLAGLAYDAVADNILVMSQESGVLLRVSLAGEILERRDVDGQQPEGFTFFGPHLWVVGEPNELFHYAAATPPAASSSNANSRGGACASASPFDDTLTIVVLVVVGALAFGGGCFAAVTARQRFGGAKVPTQWQRRDDEPVETASIELGAAPPALPGAPAAHRPRKSEGHVKLEDDADC